MTTSAYLLDKRQKMTKESWIKNVLRIHPNKTREEAEVLYQKIFGSEEKEKV